MHQRSKVDGSMAWSLPGGKFETEETLMESVQREVLEETGLAITELLLIAADTWMSIKSGVLKLGLVYVGTSSTDAVQLSEEHQDFRWCTAKELEELTFQKDVMRRACFMALGE